MEKRAIIREILLSLISERTAASGDPTAAVPTATKGEFEKRKNAVYGRFRITEPFSDSEFLAEYREMVRAGETVESPAILRLLRKRAVRSLSGVSVISVLTKPWGCPGKCVFCPTYEWLPKSYVPNEPAVQRAELNFFDPEKQVFNRLFALESIGHSPEKCDIRIIGGTWGAYPKDYRESFIIGLYDAHTNFEALSEVLRDKAEFSDGFRKFQLPDISFLQRSATMEEAQKRNETSKYRVIGVAVETRPDWVTEDEVRDFRRQGITRVEIGYQTTDDHVNDINLRGHGNAESKAATKMLKNAGIKVVGHMMPNLMGSTPDGDLASVREIFQDSGFRPDEVKIYPTVVTPGSQLETIWRNGGFAPYDDETLIALMARIQGEIPRYVRLNRMYRDIPASEILAGSKLANLRQITDNRMNELGLVRTDISAREVRAKGNDPANAVLRTTEYEASGGTEYFLEWIDPADETVFSLLRLRVPGKDSNLLFPVLQHAALIRELHTFGDQLRIGEDGANQGQHRGFGKRLIEAAETIVRERHPDITRLAVISGIGVREYYANRGYEVADGYMVKPITSRS